MWTIATQSNFVMTNDELTRKCERIINNKVIQPTSIRIEILKCFLLNPSEHYNIGDIYNLLHRKKKSISRSTIAEMLATFKSHDILENVIENHLHKKLRRKRGRPSIRYRLSHEFSTKKESYNSRG